MLKSMLNNFKCDFEIREIDCVGCLGCRFAPLSPTPAQGRVMVQDVIRPREIPRRREATASKEMQGLCGTVGCGVCAHPVPAPMVRHVVRRGVRGAEVCRPGRGRRRAWAAEADAVHTDTYKRLNVDARLNFWFLLRRRRASKTVTNRESNNTTQSGQCSTSPGAGYRSSRALHRHSHCRKR